MQIKRLFATTSFRLAALYAGLMFGAFVLAAAIAWFATLNAGRRELEQRINSEVAALTEEYRAEGLEATVLAIRSRSEHPGALEYRLSDASGRSRIGDLPTVSRLGWSITDMSSESEPGQEHEKLLIYTTRLPNEATLSVGDDVERGERIRILLLRVLAWTGLIALAVGLAMSVLLTRRSLARIDRIIAVARRVSAGELKARAELRSRVQLDDLDELSGAVNAMLDRIETLVADVKRVSTDVAHDLRTPLTHVRQHLETALAAPDHQRTLAAVRDADVDVQSALRIFDAMLRLAEIDSGAARARFSQVNLSESVERVADAFRFDVEDSGRSLSVQAQSGVIVQGDSDLIGQALANLIDNALRHTQAGARIKVVADHDGAAPRLGVEDDGPGVPADLRAAVIAPFGQLDPSRSKGGAGLGLAIVAAVARLHGAEMALQDAQPGLRVTLRFSQGARS